MLGGQIRRALFRKGLQEYIALVSFNYLFQVGEGLCYRGMDSASILLDTVVLGTGGDLFVGGNFETRVWDGRHFVSIFHVARYDGQWLPALLPSRLTVD